MGYRDDAFYNITGATRNTVLFPNQGETPNGSRNAYFQFPENTIRFLEAQDALDGVTYPGNQTRPYELQRGFIRGLPQPGISNSSNPTNMKCRFQFNPQTIEQTVVMDQSTYLPLLQDPYQFTQPMGKSTNFKFDLVFDRSREVVNGTSKQVRLESIDYSNDVPDIGAVADLYLFYAIIGQGFSQELIDFQIKRLAQAAVLEANQSGGVLENNGVTPLTSSADAEALAREAVTSLNIGNSAFLIPAPVRVVFSSLFMVDGFVTGTTVQFLKFNTKMVPLQVRIGVTMEAMYIGFAREKTFLTENLEKAGKELDRQQEEIVETQTEMTKLVKTYLSNISFGWSHNSDWRLAVMSDSNVDDSPVRLYELGFAGLRPGKNWKRKFNIGFERANKDEEGDLTYRVTPGGAIATGDQTVKEVFLDSGEPTTLSYQWWFEVYGPYDSASEANAATSSESKRNNKHIGTYAGSSNATDEWFWAKTFNEDKLQNTSKGLTHNGRTDAFYETMRNDKYYAWKIQVNLSASRNTTGGQATVSDSVTRWGSGVGSKKVYGKLPLMWGAANTPMPGDAGSGSTIPTNPSTGGSGSGTGGGTGTPADVIPNPFRPTGPT